MPCRTGSQGWSLSPCASCLGQGGGTGPRDSAGIPGHGHSQGPHTFAVGFSLRAAATGPGAVGHLALCHTDASPSAQSHACLTAALSALPPRVPRGRHEPIPPLTVAGRIGCSSSRGGDLGAAETLHRYGGRTAGTLPVPGGGMYQDVAVALVGHGHAAASPSPAMGLDALTASPLSVQVATAAAWAARAAWPLPAARGAGRAWAVGRTPCTLALKASR